MPERNPFDPPPQLLGDLWPPRGPTVGLLAGTKDWPQVPLDSDTLPPYRTPAFLDTLPPGITKADIARLRARGVLATAQPSVMEQLLPTFSAVTNPRTGPTRQAVTPQGKIYDPDAGILESNNPWVATAAATFDISNLLPVGPYAAGGGLAKLAMAAAPGIAQRIATKGARQAINKVSLRGPDFFDKYTAFGTYEATPGVMTRHRPDISGGSREVREAYAMDPRSTWRDPETGRDVLYNAVGMDARPTTHATGVYTPPGGVTETNPAEVARPLVGFTGKAGAREIDPASLATLRGVEAIRAYVDVQGAGAASKPVLTNKAGRSTSMFVPREQKMTEDQMLRLKEIGAPHGLPDVVDYGRGVALTHFYPGPPTLKDFQQSVKGGLAERVGEVAGGVPQRADMQGVYIPYEEAWAHAEGSGAVTRKLFQALRDKDAPALIDKLDADPRVRAIIVGKLERDAADAEKGAPVRADVQRARTILAKDGIRGLYEALRRGEALPALAVLAPFLLPQEGSGE